MAYPDTFTVQRKSGTYFTIYGKEANTNNFQLELLQGVRLQIDFPVARHNFHCARRKNRKGSERLINYFHACPLNSEFWTACG